LELLTLGFEQAGFDPRDQLARRFGRGTRLFRGRHFAGANAVEDLDPPREVFRLRKVETNRGQVKTSLASLGSMAFKAMVREEILRRPIRRH
jgi:hypothetical protein